MTDYWILKLNKNLNVEYESRFGEGCAQSRAWSNGAMSVKEAFNPISSNPDGYILSGCSKAGTWVIKTDLTLTKVWDRILSGRCGYGVVQSDGNVDRTDDNGFVVAKADAGLTLEKLEYEYGHTLWNTHIDSTTGGIGTAWSFEKTADSGFVAAGWDGEGDIWVVKISEEGEYAPAGSYVEVVPVDSISGESPVTMTFESVIQAGTTHLEVMTGGNPPEGFRLKPLNTFYKLDFTGSLYPMSEIRICIDLTGVAINNANSLKLEHREDVTWEPTKDQQIGYDSDGNIIDICGTVYSLSDFAVFERINNPPVADAGIDQAVQCTRKEGTAVITLDGSGSYDADEDDLSYLWTENSIVLGSEQTVIADLYLGEHQISLTVDDGIDTDADEIVVNVYASIEGLAELTRAFTVSGEISSIFSNRLLEYLTEAEKKIEQGKPDKAARILVQFKGAVDKEKDKENITVNVAEILTGSADCVRVFSL